MTTDRDVTQAVRSWLNEGATRLPDRVLDAVLDQVPNLPQRRAWWPWSGDPRSRPAAILAAVGLVAVVVLASLQIAHFPSTTGVAPNTTPSPSPSPTPAESVGASAAPHVVEVPANGPMSGRFVYTSVNGTGINVEFTAPPNWSACCGGYTESTDGSTQFMVWEIGLVYPDPCDRPTAATTVGPTVQDLVNALSDQSGRLPLRASPSAAPFAPERTVVSGFSGLRMQVRVPLDTVIGNCTRGEYVAWAMRGHPDDTRYNQGPGQIDDLRIVDVEGTTITIQTTYEPTTSAARRAELETLVSSIMITPAPRPSPVPTQPPESVGFLPTGEFP